MNTRLTTNLTAIVFSIVTALTIVACGGGLSNVAGIGGSGFISSGSISGFGSVFVNGVEFETDTSSFDIEGVPGTQDDLAIGMIVRVSGTINDDGISGTATHISFDDELQGPVSAMQNLDLGITKSFTVLGVNVIIDSGTTTFDISDDLPVDTVFSFTDIADGNNVEISGFFDTDGNLMATRVELEDIVFNPNSIVEVKGIILNFNAGTNTFNLGTLLVDAASAEINDLPNGLANSQFVEVKGTFNAIAGIITATKVEGKDDDFEDTDEFELEGLITDYVNNGNFKIAGINVDASNASLEPLSLILEDGLRVEVEGTILNGVLIADEVELRGGNAKVRATVSNVNVSNNTFDVTPVTGQPAIKVTITSSTKFEDDISENELFGLSDLMEMNYVEVHGFDDGNGGITATEVQLKEPEGILVQGVIQSGNATDSKVKVFGVEFMIVPQTEFEDSNGDPLNVTEFFDSENGGVDIGKTVIKVEDNGTGNGVADEIEIEID